MSEPAVKNGKTRAQLDAQIGRIHTAIDRALDVSETAEEARRYQRRWRRATDAYGNLTGDNKLIRSFLTYRPASRGFTTYEEMDRINDHFGLEKRSVPSLMALRNNVVAAWAYRDRNSDDDDGMTQWMWSITATIDEHIRRKGGQL